MDGPEDDPIPERTEQLALTVGTVWRDARVSCPHRDILRSYKAGMTGPAADYIRFHVEEAQCPYCQANLDDFEREDTEAAGEQLGDLRDRLLSSTMSMIREKREND